MGGLGPMAGQANHFLNYSKEDLAYPKKRYTDEVHRLFGVMNKRLATRKFLAGAYSIADMACWGWVVSATRISSRWMNFPISRPGRSGSWRGPAVKRGHGWARNCASR